VRSDTDSALNLISRSSKITVIAHERPDGDAVGSLLAFALALANSGKDVTPILADGLPARFRFLPGSAGIEKKVPPDAELVIAVDCSDKERMGIAPEPSIDINIDHHPTNAYFAKLNFVRPDAAATAEILYELLPAFGLQITSEIATNLLTGIVTDTIGFRTHSVTPQLLEIAVDLMNLGAPLAEIYEIVLGRRSFTSVRYWGCGLDRIERGDGLVWTTLTLADREKVGYPGDDDADLVNLLTEIEDTQVSIIFVEQPGGKVKVSWRSDPGINVAEIASEFGGGGHEQASGAMIEGELEEVRALVINATKAQTNQA